MNQINYKKRGYIFIEVIISIIILSFVSIALLKVSSSQKYILNISTKKIFFDNYTTPILNRHSILFNNKEIDLKDFLSKYYIFKNDRVKNFLKNKKILYKQKNISKIGFKDKKIDILIDKISISNKDGRTNYLTIREEK